jgi:hypothetical protein
MWHGCVCFYLTLIGFGGPGDTNGLTYENWYYSTIIFALVIHVVTLKLFVDTHYWSLILL